jgi:hypothetical protein
MRLGVALVIEVVKQPGNPPCLQLGPDDPEAMFGVPDDRRFDRQAVLAQSLTGRPLGQKLPGVLASRSGHLRLALLSYRREGSIWSSATVLVASSTGRS